MLYAQWGWEAGLRAGSSQAGYQPGAISSHLYRTMHSTKPFGQTWLLNREQSCDEYSYYFHLLSIMFPIQDNKLLQMERAWRNWNEVGLCSQCAKFRVAIFLLKCFFSFFFCHGNKHGAHSFCLAVFVYGGQCVVWVKHVAPVFVFVWCTGVWQKAWHGCCGWPAFLCGKDIKEDIN